MEHKEHTHCLRCHRALKNPERRIIGYGKICESKIVVDRKPRPLFDVNAAKAIMKGLEDYKPADISGSMDADRLDADRFLYHKSVPEGRKRRKLDEEKKCPTCETLFVRKHGRQVYCLPSCRKHNQK